jgi:excisionase family DNA binding protein
MRNQEVDHDQLGPILLSLRDAATRLSIAVPTLRRWIRERRLAHVRCGRVVRIESNEVQRFIAQNRCPARDEAN